MEHLDVGLQAAALAQNLPRAGLVVPKIRLGNDLLNLL